MPLTLRYDTAVRPVVFLDRPNRYLARVRAPGGGRAFLAHVPNPGRMEELLVPGETRGYVAAASGPERRTAFDLISVVHGRTLVSVDSRVGNRMGRRALAAGVLPEFGAGPWRSEVRWGKSRLDFAAGPQGGRPTALLEIKCSNLKVGNAAMFPDAPTIRGTRHVRELALAARSGLRAGVLFLVQRSDARIFRPNAVLDPEFAQALRDAAQGGVVIQAWSVRVRPDRLEWDRRLPVDLADRATPLVGAAP